MKVIQQNENAQLIFVNTLNCIATLGVHQVQWLNFLSIEYASQGIILSNAQRASSHRSIQFFHNTVWYTVEWQSVGYAYRTIDRTYCILTDNNDKHREANS